MVPLGVKITILSKLNSQYWEKLEIDDKSKLLIAKNLISLSGSKIVNTYSKNKKMSILDYKKNLLIFEKCYF